MQSTGRGKGDEVSNPVTDSQKILECAPIEANGGAVIANAFRSGRNTGVSPVRRYRTGETPELRTSVQSNLQIVPVFRIVASAVGPGAARSGEEPVDPVIAAQVVHGRVFRDR